MNTRTFVRSGVVAIAAASLLHAAPAAAQVDDATLDCRNAISKNFGKLVKTGLKVVAGCHKSRNKDPLLIGTDCNDLTAADAEKDKFASGRTKLISAVTDKCDPDGVFALTAANDYGSDKEWYVTCPISPCTGVTDNVVNTATELASCLACIAEDVAEQTGVDTLGLPDPNNLDSDEQKCHGAIAKNFGKFFNKAYKEETACQKTADASTGLEYAGCVDADPKLKASGALSKAVTAVTDTCDGLTLTDIDGCATDTSASLAACSSAIWVAAEDASFVDTWEWPTDACPSAVRTTIRGGCSTMPSCFGGANDGLLCETDGDCPGGECAPGGACAGGDNPGAPCTSDTDCTGGGTCNLDCSSGYATGTVLSVGWKGPGHGVDVTDAYTLAVNVTCDGSGVKGDCGTCTSTGISTDNPQYTDFSRCSSQSWVKCTMPFQNDPVCNSGMGGPCRYFLGPPLAVSADGSPTCTMNIVNSNIIGGTGDPDAGTADFNIDLAALVHTGIGQERPCPYCRNDPSPQDGNTSGGTCDGGDNDGDDCADDDDCPSGDCIGNFGSCFGGPRDGQPCDVQGFDLTFANVDGLDAPQSGNSLDCPPTSGANISGTGLAIDLPLTTGFSSKDAVDPCESPNAGLDCFCGICSLAQTQACDSDADCVGVGTCLAGGLFAGVVRRPNNCSDGICTLVSSDRGECSTAPDIDTFCSGLLFASGKGVLACGMDADCDALISMSANPDLWTCPGNDCGTCSVASFRSCFNDPIEITGTPDPGNPILAGTFCLPPSSNGTVNAATGQPGPGVVQADSIVELRY